MKVESRAFDGVLGAAWTTSRVCHDITSRAHINTKEKFKVVGCEGNIVSVFAEIQLHG